MKHNQSKDDALVLAPTEGRSYPCGTMTAIFKADENETENKYSISEWWLEPSSEGPGAHQHDENDDIFYVIEGTISVLLGDKWIEAPKGSFIRIPAGTTHNFANKTDSKAGILNFFVPGGFERNMPSIVQWYEDNNEEREST